jgi:hypothetical protein
MFAVDINVGPSQDTVDTNDYATIWDGRNNFVSQSVLHSTGDNNFQEQTTLMTKANFKCASHGYICIII